MKKIFITTLLVAATLGLAACSESGTKSEAAKSTVTVTTPETEVAKEAVQKIEKDAKQAEKEIEKDAKKAIEAVEKDAKKVTKEVKKAV